MDGVLKARLQDKTWIHAISSSHIQDVNEYDAGFLFDSVHHHTIYVSIVKLPFDHIYIFMLATVSYDLFIIAKEAEEDINAQNRSI